jgi:hypothetical protein
MALNLPQRGVIHIEQAAHITGWGFVIALEETGAVNGRDTEFGCLTGAFATQTKSLAFRRTVDIIVGT